MATVKTDLAVLEKEADRLLFLLRSLTPLAATHQKLVAEIILLRLFTLFEQFVSMAAMKLACGARYVDGSTPRLLVRATSIADSVRLFQTHSRSRQKFNLPWTKAGEIKDNIKHVIDSGDHFVTLIDIHGTLIDEIRRIRNRIAHNNKNARKHFSIIVQRHYGAALNQVTPGILLLTNRKSPSLLEQYIRQIRTLCKTLVRA